MRNSFIQKYIAVSFTTTLIAFYAGIWWAKFDSDRDFIEYKKNIDKCIESLDIELELDEVPVNEILPGEIDEVDSVESNGGIEILPEEVDSVESNEGIEILPGETDEVDSTENIIDTEKLFTLNDSSRVVDKQISWSNPLTLFSR